MSITRRQLLAGTAAAGAAAAIGALLVGQADPRQAHDPASTAWGASTRRGASSCWSPSTAGTTASTPSCLPRTPPTVRRAGALALPETKVLPLSDGLSLHPSLTGVRQPGTRGAGGDRAGSRLPEPDPQPLPVDGRLADRPARPVRHHGMARALARHPWQPGPAACALHHPDAAPPAPGDQDRRRRAAPGRGHRADRRRGVDAYRRLNAPTGDDLAGRIHQTGTDLLTVSSRLHEALAAVPADATPSNGGALEPPATSAPAPKAKGGAAHTGLAAQMDTIARLIKAGIPTRVYSASLGGFDTHVTEARQPRPAPHGAGSGHHRPDHCPQRSAHGRARDPRRLQRVRAPRHRQRIRGVTTAPLLPSSSWANTSQAASTETSRASLTSTRGT